MDLLCHDRKTGAISRQYCSDPDWPEDSCSSACSRTFSIPSSSFYCSRLIVEDYSAAGIALTPCDKTGTKFCCGPSDDCCKNGNFTQINKRTGQVVAIGTSKVATSTTATPTSSSSSTAAPASATTTDAGSSGGSGGGGLTEQAKLGIGLGVGLGVPFLGAVAAALFFWRRTLLSQAQAQSKGGDAGEMAKVASPGPGPSGPAPGPGSGTGSASSPPSVPGYGQNAAAAVSGTGVAGAAATEPVAGTTGREVELGENQLSKPVYQLEAETNTRSELEDGSGTRRLYELQ